jgi:L-threonylcarbamoyladenylate synthase
MPFREYRRAAARLRYSDATADRGKRRAMPPKVQRIDPQHLDPAILARAADLIRGGLLVAYPTETFYGLACDPWSVAAVDRVFEAKGRPDRMALPLLAADRAAAEGCVRATPDAARRLMEAFWPGPLTLVLMARDDFPPRLLGGGQTVGVRVSPHPVASALARAVGSAIVATSANRSGQPPPSTAQEVAVALGGDVSLILDGGATLGGNSSTVLDLTTDTPRLIRSGPISTSAIESILGQRLG